MLSRFPQDLASSPFAASEIATRIADERTLVIVEQLAPCLIMCGFVLSEPLKRDPGQVFFPFGDNYFSRWTLLSEAESRARACSFFREGGIVRWEMYGPPLVCKQIFKIGRDGLRKCIRPVCEACASGHNEIRAYLS